MIDAAIALTVIAVALGAAAGFSSRWQGQFFNAAWGVVGLLALCLLVDLMT